MTILTTEAGRHAMLRGDTWARRATDIIVASVLLAVALPLLILIAIAVMLDSPGSPVYGQRRIGRNEHAFVIWKFRSMVKDAATRGPLVSGAHDPRVTRVGAVLRRTKLDELLQLVNVVTGDMTLVGPRPEVPRYVVHYDEGERLVLTVRPGVTSPGSLSYSRYGLDALDDADDPERWYIEHQLHPKLADDLRYLRRRGLRTDLAVVAATFTVLLPRPAPSETVEAVQRAA